MVEMTSPYEAGPVEARADRGAVQARALRRVALRSRIRAITGGRLEVADGDLDPSVPAFATEGHVFYQTDDVRGLGPALRWAAANEARTLTLVAEVEAAGHLARRADHLAGPDSGGPIERVEVWAATGPEVEPARPVTLEPPPELPGSHLRFASMVAEAGARPVDDHGLLVAEVAGLEVARVVDGGEDGVPDGAGPRLLVGVGQADRELQGYIHGHLDDDANLRRAIAAVVRHRNPRSAAHPLSRLSRQRWLRSVLLDDPGLIGLVADLDPVAPLRPRRTLLSQEPVAARTRSGDGRSTVVVCSVGVDLDLLPEAADYRHREDPEADLVVVVPERDRQLAAGSLAGAVPRLRVVSVASPWDPPAP